jgi:TolB-like protein
MHKDRSINIYHLLYLLLITFFILHPMGTNCKAADDAKPVKVAFLPFTAHAAKDLSYLQEGIRDMLASRLSTNAGIVVVDKALVDQTLANLGTTTADKTIPPEELPRLAKNIGADYLVTGSLTALGSGMSIDAKVVQVGDSTSPQTFYRTAATEDDVIPAINQLAADISAKIFHRPVPALAAAPVQPTPSPTPVPTAETPPATYQTPHPEKAFMGAVSGTGSQVMQQGRFGSVQDFTKSQNFNFGIQGMDVGDVDGDGVDDIVLADQSAVLVYHRNGNNFSGFGNVTLAKSNKIHCISLADLNNNGRDEIYISTDTHTAPKSFGVEWQGADFAFLIKNAPWYIKAVNLPGQGMILAGQRAGYNRPLEPGVYQLTGAQGGPPQGKLNKGERLPLPKEVNVFSFAMADIDGDGGAEIIFIDERDHLNVLRPGGKSMWRSSGLFGGTTRDIGKDMPVQDPEKNINALEPEKYGKIFVPSRIISVDLNEDGLQDVVVNRNQLKWSPVFPNLKNYTSGQILGLTWNGISMNELWYTKTVDGYLTDYQFRTAANTDQGQLYVSLILPTGFTLSSARDSTVLMYGLTLGNKEPQE